VNPRLTVSPIGPVSTQDADGNQGQAVVIPHPIHVDPNAIAPLPAIYHTGEVNVFGYYPEYPGSDPAKWGAWWQDPSQWEFPHLSRSPLWFRFDPLSRYYREMEIMSQMEFVICRRCIPHFKKEVSGFVVAVCPLEVWMSLKMIFSAQCTPEAYSTKRKYVPKSGWYLPDRYLAEEKYCIDRVTWNSAVNIPSLIHEYWFMLKWVSQKGTIFRSMVTYLSLCYDYFMASIKCDIEYNTEYYCDTTRKWKLI